MTFELLNIDPVVLLLPLGIAVAGFVAIWPFSVWRRDASLVDVAWGPGFLGQMCVVAYLLPDVGTRGILLLLLVGIWSLRLGWVIIRRRIREGHEDPRYASMRKSWGKWFWLKSLFVVFALQAVIQWLLVLAPIHGMLAEDQQIGVLSAMGICISLSGLMLETVADRQLDDFKQRNHDQRKLLKTGLRAYVRHPNYTGEIIFWIGVACIVLEGGALIALLSPVLITLLLTKVSGVPLLDERLGDTRSDFSEYRKRVPAFFPRVSKRHRS